MPTFTAGALGVNFDQIDIALLGVGQLSAATATSFVINSTGETDQFFGSGFAFAAAAFPVSGTITEVVDTTAGVQNFDISGISLPTATLATWISTDDSTTAKLTIFGGSDVINGSDSRDLLRGYGGDDTMNGAGGDDFVDGGDGNNIIHGGLGNDVIVVSSGVNYLRGDEGDDQILGGIAFDDINGNMGNDTLAGGVGDDWVVGGKDNDSQSGDDGDDIVWGNLGNDTLDGGAGNDQVRGGQGDDILFGGPGNDFISGDRGNDTETGGTGTDIFHTFSGAGLDKVLDFNLAEGDRVMLDPGTTFTVSQVGADTVIDMGNGDQMILVGVQMATLTGSWIFGA
jgi:Ca2+-binding RTX toxin-like protein